MFGLVSMNMPATTKTASSSNTTDTGPVPKPITHATKACGTLSTVSA